MNQNLILLEIERLSVAERLRLIEQVWDQLAASPETVEVPDWHRTELDARLAARERDLNGEKPWAEVQAEILDALRK